MANKRWNSGTYSRAHEDDDVKGMPSCFDFIRAFRALRTMPEAPSPDTMAQHPAMVAEKDRRIAIYAERAAENRPLFDPPIPFPKELQW